MIVVTALSALAIGLSFNLFLGDLKYYSSLILTLVAVFTFLVLFLFQVIFLNDWRAALLVILLEVALISLPLLSYWPSRVAVIAGVSFLLFLWAFFRGQAALKNMVRVEFSAFRHSVLTPALLSVLIFLIGTYVSLSDLRKVSLPEGTVSFFVYPFEPIIAGFLPNFSLDDSFGNVLRSVSFRAYAYQLEQLDPPARAQLVESSILKFRESIQQAVNIRLGLDENIVTVTNKVITVALAKIPPAYKRLTLLLLGLVLLFVISGGAHLVSLFIGFLAWLVFRLLVMGGFIQTASRKIEQEVVKL